MADGTEYTGAKPSMPPKLAEFLDTTFPDDGRWHTLALGERHDVFGHTQWLRKHLPALQERDVCTIGLEWPAEMNVFFWAYKDGTLQHALGSRRAAEDYLFAIAATRFKAKLDVLHATVNLATHAMDAGMDVICYDARDRVGDHTKQAQAALREELGIHELLLASDAEELRRDPISFIHYFSQKGSRDEDIVLAAWCMHEYEGLLQHNPDYQKRLKAIDNVITVGHRFIHEKRIGSDGLSACLMQALASSDGNRITIGGAQHTAGLHNFNIHGLFAHHMQVLTENEAGSQLSEENAPQRHRVSSVVLARRDDMPLYRDILAQEKKKSDPPYVPSAIPMVDLEDGTQHTLFSYEHHDAANMMDTQDACAHHGLQPSLTEQWFFSAGDRARLQEGRAKQFANPMLIPELKKASAAVHALMHGEPARVR